jgi:23S rRNA pseudouridine1911/1915/1917 synthase
LPASSGSGWLPASLNSGWTYRDRITARQAGTSVSAFYARRYRHTDAEGWRDRLASGDILRNGQTLLADEPLHVGDALSWRRPPWREQPVPASWEVVFEDGDLHGIAKPSGLPVLPAGGFLEHTLLRLLERRFAGQPVPRPVHRLGRFTSGVLLCARSREARAWTSALLRDSTRRGSAGAPVREACPAAEAIADRGVRKTYRALLVPGVLPLEPGRSLTVTVPIGRARHRRLGEIWCARGMVPSLVGPGLATGVQAAEPGEPSGSLRAHSRITLLERRAEADLVAVTIATGRPHQIRIHCAAIGAPLLGDPLYLAGGGVNGDGLPGQGGYRLHAHRLQLLRPDGSPLELEAPLPAWAAVQPRSKTISREK